MFESQNTFFKKYQRVFEDLLKSCQYAFVYLDKSKDSLSTDPEINMLNGLF